MYYKNIGYDDYQDKMERLSDLCNTLGYSFDSSLKILFEYGKDAQAFVDLVETELNLRYNEPVRIESSEFDTNWGKYVIIISPFYWI